MTWCTPSLALLASICVLTSVPVHAQANRTFISGTGTDSNPCTFNSPCRTAQRAHDQTNPGGEINVLDPAGYGSLIINRAISIQGHGLGELVGAAGVVAVTINAAQSDKISISGVIIEGSNSGDRGIVFNSGATLLVQDSTIRDFLNDGIYLVPRLTSTLAVLDTVISNNGGNGIFMGPSGDGGYRGTFSHVQSFNNYIGIQLNGSALGSGFIGGIAVDCTIIGANINTGYGLLAQNNVRLFSVLRVTVIGHLTGIQSNGGFSTIVQVSDSHLEHTSTPWAGVVTSFGDNYTNGNSAPIPGLEPKN